MALLGISRVFNAKHGSTYIRSDEFEVELTIEGRVENNFVAGVDSVRLSADLDSVIEQLSGKYLDDTIGRATSENVAAYIFYQLRKWPVHTVKVSEGNSHYAQLFASDVDFANYEALRSYNLSRSLLYRGKVSEAIKAASDALELNPDFAEAYNLRGRCFRVLNDWETALPDFEMAAKLKPDFGEAYRNIGNSYYYLDRTGEMVTMFTKAVELMQHSALAWNNRGYAYQRLGMFRQAVEDHQRAIQLDNCYAEAHSDLAEALSHIGESEKAKEEKGIAADLVRTGQDTHAPEKRQMY
ncbi:tetratricopeptide repeat protein [Candidatus Woesearchaeota archaeon]|nr:tetratricopeptide repeat protein [Candidatus Woesearchaeota archaeon]